jgi:hypothetical protein
LPPPAMRLMHLKLAPPPSGKHAQTRVFA